MLGVSLLLLLIAAVLALLVMNGIVSLQCYHSHCGRCLLLVE